MKKEVLKNGFGKRVFSLLLAVIMVAGMLPEMTIAWAAPEAVRITTVADPDTVSRPADVYGDNTENAGKITVGKSVTDQALTLNYGNTSATFTPDENNFMVTVSQTAQVMGLSSKSSVPVDVVFVLDTSGSMEDNSRATTMVAAANSAIKTLMNTNPNNRVGVVAFSSEGYGGGTSGNAAASVLSDLAHYTGDAANNHLQWVSATGTTQGDRTYISGRKQTTATIRNGRNWVSYSGNAFRNGINGGTNIQAGIIAGAQLLTSVTDTVYVDPDTGKSVNRIPFLIILSDGQPTFSYDDATWYDPATTGNNAAEEQGPGDDSYEGNGFIAALTAAYYKGLITERYYGDKADENNRCFVYTMGIEIAKLTGDDLALAEITLNPKERTTGTYADAGAASYWNYGNTANDRTRNADYGWKTYWNNYLKSPASNFTVRVDSGDDYTFTAAATTASRKYVNGVGYEGGIAYNDQYFDAADVSDLEQKFKALLTTIQEKAISVPTHVDESFGSDFSGYVSFYDPIGEYMEVKKVHGVLGDGKLYQGKTFANYLQNWSSAPQAFKDQFTRALTERCRLTGTTIDVDAFVAQAVASANQAYYNSADDYDNSIVWWGHSFTAEGEEDVQMQLLSFADNDTIDYIEAQKAAGTVPEGADYVCRSYFFYGTAGDLTVTPDKDFLFFMVRVQRSLTAPYQETVVVSAPASLLAVEKVMITENTDAQGNVTYTAKVTEAEPARVVYEVGLRSDINAYNVSQILASDPTYVGETAEFGGVNVATNYDPATDTYSFYTNDWDRSEPQASHHRAMAHATFDAAVDNSFYTYQEDTLIYVRSGNGYAPYTGTAKPVGTGYYYARTVYDWSGASLNADGTYAAEAKTVYIPVTLPDIEGIKQVGSGWYISKGLYKASSLTGGEDVYKAENLTQTSDMVAHPHRTEDEYNSHYTVCLGNNGRLTLNAVDTKQVQITKPDQTVITDADGKVVMVGDTLTYTIDVVNGGDTAADATVTDKVPQGTSYVEGSATKGGTYDAATGSITWNLTGIGAGEAVSVSFQVLVTEAALTGDLGVVSIDNTAYVTLSNGFEYSTNTTTNPPEGKKVVDSEGDPIQGGVAVPDVLVYRIRYHNDSDMPATVVITDIIPSGTVYVAGSASDNGVYDAEAGTITWTIQGVMPGGSDVVSFRVAVDPSAGERVENSATIKIGNNDPRQTNKTYNEVEKGDLLLSKTVLSTAYPSAMNREYTLRIVDIGGFLSGTFEMTRNGQTENGGITFTDGVATVTIKHGDQLRIQGLTVGTVLSVTETVLPGFTPAYIVNGGAASNQEGRVTIQAGTQAASVAVQNTYAPAPISAELTGTKTLETLGDLGSTTFGFTAYACDANGANLDGSKLLTGEVTVSSQQKTARITFGTLSFGEPGTYYYLISEVDGGLTGISYTDDQYLLTVVVSDDGSGALKAVPSLKVRSGENGSFTSVNEISFVNTYAPTPIALALEATKVLTGRELKAGEFSFVVKDASGTVVSTGTNDRYGKITFREITYNAPGTYTYTVSEVNGGLKGVEYSNASYTVTVTVIDNNGILFATPAYPGGTGITFTNTYIPEGVSVTLKGTKNLTGRNLTAGEFNFVVKEGQNTVATGTNDEHGNILFRPIGYTVADVGTHTYVVSEVHPDLAVDPNMYYDPATFQVTVTVSYDASTGVLSVSEPVYDKPVVFANIQNPDSVEVTPAATKTTASAPEGVSFSFVVINTETGVEAGAGVGAANGAVQFSKLSFSQTGTYTYWIRETHAGETKHGITYDNTRYLMQVVVTRDTTNKLVAQVSYFASETDGSVNVADYTKSVDAIAFQNTYAASGHINLTAAKVLTGNRELKVGDFAFKLVRQDTQGEIDGVITAVANNEGTVTFATMYYSLDDLGGQSSAVLHYVMEEVIPEISKIPGVTYDTAKHDVYVRISNNGDGTIKAELVRPENGDYVAVEGFNTGVTFTNSYSPVTGTSQTIGARKTLSGRTLNAGEFSFELYHGKTLVATASNAADGTVTFPTRNYPANILPQGASSMDVIYEIREVNNNLGGVSYSTDVYCAVVTIIDNGDGSLSSTLTYTDANLTNQISPDAVVFANTYDAKDATFTPTANKTANFDLDGGEFSFVVTDSNGQVVSTGINAAAGANNPAAIAFTPIGITSKGSFIYTVSEVKGNLPGVMYTNAVFYLKVEVTDNNQGELIPVGTYYTDQNCTQPVASATFTNIHVADDVSVQFEAYKTLAGRDMDKGEFSFVVKDASGKIVATGGNAAATDGTAAAVTFSTIGFKHSDLTDGSGEFIYTISELRGTEGGITYSSAVYYAKVTVVYDSGERKLIPTVTYYSDANCTQQIQPDAVVFANTYKPAPASLVIPADKTLINKTLEAGEFKFLVLDEDGEEVADGTNNLEGVITFDAITFSAAGEYTFTVSEAVSAGYDAARYTLDDSFTVVVTVTDNGRGQLVATAAYYVDYDPNGENVNLGGVEFINYYTAPTLVLPLDTQIGATKTVQTPNGITYSPEGFRFAVVDVTGSIINGYDASGAPVEMIGVSDADGNISFPNFRFEKAGEYHYWIAEMDSDKGGITEDTRVWEIHILVRYNEQTGLLYVEQSDVHTYLRDRAADGSSKPAFVNVYETQPAALTLTATKVLTGRALNDREFLFYLMEGDVIAAQGYNDVNGNVAFTLKYDTVGTHTYTIREYIPETGLGGVTYDENAYSAITVDVRDDGKGQLVVYIGGEPVTQGAVVGTGVTVTNTYTAKAATARIEANKILTGGKLLTDGAYSFLLQNDRNPQDTYTAGNDLLGKIAFELSYSAVGVYTYTLSEVKGNDANTTYDPKTYTVTVTVLDDGKGQLHAQVSYSTADTLAPVFTNIYTPSPIAVVLKGTKKLEGRTLRDGEFKFLVLDEDGEEVADGTNNLEGVITFDAITFSAAGEYTFTVSEVNAGEKGMRYDSTVYEVTVTVVNQDGVLIPTVEYPEDGLVFENVYKAPVTPNTGDSTPVTALLTVLALAAAAFLALLMGKKRFAR